MSNVAYDFSFNSLNAFGELLISAISFTSSSENLKFLIRDEIQKFIFGYEKPKKEISEEEEMDVTEEKTPENEIEQLNTDHSIQLIELLEEMHLIEDAFSLTENLLRNISPEDIRIDAVRQTLSRLKKAHI